MESFDSSFFAAITDDEKLSTYFEAPKLAFEEDGSSTEAVFFIDVFAVSPVFRG